MEHHRLRHLGRRLSARGDATASAGGGLLPAPEPSGVRCRHAGGETFFHVAVQPPQGASPVRPLTRAGLAQRGRAAAYRWAPRLVILAVGALLVYLVLVPIGFLVLGSFLRTGLVSDLGDGLTLANYERLLARDRTVEVALRTLTYGAGVTVLAVLVAGCFAWLTERTNIPAKGLLRALILIPMAVPPLLLGISWILLASPEIGFLNELAMRIPWVDEPPLDVYTLPGMIFVQALSTVPSVYLILSPSFRSMDPSLEEAAYACGASSFNVFRRIFLPVVSPAILAALTYCFVLSLMVFDIPGLIGLPSGIRVFSTEVWLQTNPPAGLPRYGDAAAMSGVYLLVTLLAAWYYLRATRQSERFGVISGRGYRPRQIELGRWRWPAMAAVAGYFLFAVVAPLVMLAYQSLSPYYGRFLSVPASELSLDSYSFVLGLSGVREAIRNTLIVGALSATAVVAFTMLTSWLVIRSRLRGARILDLLTFLPFAMPPILIGLALIYVYLSIKVLPIYGSIAILVIAYCTLYLPFGSRVSNSTLLQVSRELEEAGRTSGASALTVGLRIVAPLLLPAIIGSWVWVAAHTMRELTIALFLQSHRNTMVSTLIWTYWQTGVVPPTAAIGVMLIAVIVVLVSVWQYLEFRRQRNVAG